MQLILFGGAWGVWVAADCEVAKLFGKMASSVAVAATFNIIEQAHQLYRDGRHDEALGFYTEALSMAKTKPQKIALHSNRAACYLKLHDFKTVAEECTSVLELDRNHTGALMLRAQTLVTLKEYQSALFDVNRLMELNPSSDVYHSLQARLKTQLSLAPIPESEEEVEAESEEEAMEAAAEEGEDELEEEIETEGQQEPTIDTAAMPYQEAEMPSSNPKLPVKQFQNAKVQQEKRVVAVMQHQKAERPRTDLKFPVTQSPYFQQKGVADAVVVSHQKVETPSNGAKVLVPQTQGCKVQQDKPAAAAVLQHQKAEPLRTNPKISVLQTRSPLVQQKKTMDAVMPHQKAQTPGSNHEHHILQNQSIKNPADTHSKAWEAIPKPKGHSGLDYSRWDQVEDDSSEEEEEEDAGPQYRFRVRTIGVRPVK
ncbi:hypothetical protein ACLOJK_021564 [Asimina triloba]